MDFSDLGGVRISPEKNGQKKNRFDFSDLGGQRVEKIQTNPSGQASRAIAQMATQFLQPQTGIPLQGQFKAARVLEPLLDSAFQGVRNLRQRAEEMGPSMAEKGIPVPIAAGVSGAARGALEMAPASRLEGAAQIMGGAILRGAKPAAKAIGKSVVEDIGPTILSGLTGVSKAAARTRLKGAVDLVDGSLNNPEAMEKILSEFRDGITNARSFLGKKIENLVNRFESKAGQTMALDIQSVKNIAQRLLTDKTGRVSPLFDQVDEILSAVSSGTASLAQAVDMRRSIQGLAEYSISDPSGQIVRRASSKENRAVQFLAKFMNRQIERNIKATKLPEADNLIRANKEFSDIADTMAVLQKEFLEAKAPDEKLVSIFRKDSTALRNLRKVQAMLPRTLQFLDQAEKAFVTREFSPLIRPVGWLQVAGGAAGGAGLAGGATAAASTAALAAAATSPRLMGAAARAGVEAGRMAGKAINPAVEALIRNPKLRAALIAALSR